MMISGKSPEYPVIFEDTLMMGMMVMVTMVLWNIHICYLGMATKERWNPAWTFYKHTVYTDIHIPSGDLT